MENLTVDSEIVSSIENFVNQLENDGLKLEQKVPKLDFNAAWQAYGESHGQEILAGQPIISWDNILTTLKINYYKFRVDRRYRNSPLERGFMKAFPPSLDKYMQALTKRDRFIAQMDRFLDNYDVFLCPASSSGIPVGIQVVGKKLQDLLFLAIGKIDFIANCFKVSPGY